MRRGRTSRMMKVLYVLFRMEIMKKEGLADLEDHAEKIILYAKLVYTRNNVDFRMALKQQEEQFEKESEEQWKPFIEVGQN